MNILRSVSLLALASTALSASAAPIDFEDVPGAFFSGGTIIPNGYAGLNWDSFGVYGRGAAFTPGYANGIVSGDYAAFNRFSQPATLSVAAGGPLITTFSGRFTAAFNDGQILTVEGLLNGSVVATGTKILNTSGPSTYGLSFAGGVDAIRFSTTDINANQFTLDDLEINAVSSVPGPLAALPFALMALKRRRKA